MNLSGGLNLSGRSNMFGSTKNCIEFFKIYTGAQFKPVLGDLNRGLNSLNSDTDELNFKKYKRIRIYISAQ